MVIVDNKSISPERLSENFGGRKQGGSSAMGNTMRTD